MWKRICAIVFGVLIFTAIGASNAQAVVFGPPQEGQKVTLSQTSIDGPALWTYPTGSPKSILAWTATDTLHHLEYMTSDDGLRYGVEHLVRETSLWRPSVTFTSEGRAGLIVLAWTGTDPAHTLNVLYIDAYSFQPLTKLTLWGETSFTAPSIAALGTGEMRLAWTGTDPQHTLNVMSISRFRQVESKTTLWGDTSLSRPDLQYERITQDLLLSWTTPQERINFSTSKDAVHWTNMSAYPINEWSGWAPSMIETDFNMPPHYLAWTGIDPAHSVNVAYTEGFPTWDISNPHGPKVVLDEQALGGPELGYVGKSLQVLVAWTGVDPAHHLNVAVVYVNL